MPRLARRIIAVAILSVQALLGQTPPAAPEKSAEAQMGTTSIRKHGWSEEGALVLAVNMRGGKSGTSLGGVKGKGTRESLDLFTMGSSSLTDLHSGKILQPLSQLPRQPFYGSMTGILRLEPGDIAVFGVAFPRPPEPPKDKDGKTMDYKLKLEVPGMAPLEFLIPYQIPATPAPR